MTKSKTPSRAPLRRWWQRVIRLALLLIVGLMTAYITLPVWAPAGLIKQRLARQMSDQMGLDVQIDHLSLSWSHGVELYGLRISSPPGYAEETMVFVRKIHTAFSPVDFFLHKRLAWMDIDQPHLAVEIDEKGHANIAPLDRLKFPVQTQQMSLRNGLATLRLAHHTKLLRIHVQDGQYVAGWPLRLGRLTVSAMLDQQGGPAPVGLQLSAGSSQQIVAADAQFTFSDVDLSQLHLPTLLGLPLQHAQGRCRGSLNLQINRQGQVDQFSFDLSVADLDVQPINGPEIPVIEEAHLRIAAAYDPISEHLQLQSASVRLPGLELAGRAAFFKDVGLGQWQAIDELELQGVVHPQRLAALLGRPCGGDSGWQIDGPVNVRLNLLRRNSLYEFFTEADAMEAQVLHHQTCAKPAGRKLKATLKGLFDQRSWTLQINENATQLTLGQNVFKGGGKIEDIRMLLDKAKEDRTLAWQNWLYLLKQVEWEGTCRITDARSLSDMVISQIALPVPIELQGALNGRWSIQQFADPRLHCSFAAPAGTYLAIGRHFVKDLETPMSLDVTGKLESAEGILRRIEADLVLGEGRLSLAGGSLRLQDRPEGSTVIEADAQLHCVSAESLLACFPKLHRQQNVAIQGQLDGRCRLSLCEETRRVCMQVDLQSLEMKLGRFFQKPASRPGELSVELSQDLLTVPIGKTSLNVAAKFGEATATALLQIPPAASGESEFSLHGQVEITQARWLLDSSPWLADRFGNGRASGPLVLSLIAQREGERFEVDLAGQADGMDVAWGEKHCRRKAAGVPLRGQVSLLLSEAPNQAASATIEKATFELGASSLHLSGQTLLTTTKSQEKKKLIPAWLHAGEAQIQTSVTLDHALMALLPELADDIDRYGLAGRLTGNFQFRSDERQLFLAGRLDAQNLSITQGPLSGGIFQKDLLGPWSKPKGLPVEVQFELTTGDDLTYVKLNNLHAQSGKLSILADADIRFDSTTSGLPGAWRQIEAHLAFSLADAAMLCDMAPQLKDYAPSGEVFAELQLTASQPERFNVTSAFLSSTGLSGHMRGKDVHFAGELLLHDFNFKQGRMHSIGQLSTDGLELRIGNNHAYLITNLKNLPYQASGDVHVLVNYLDDKTLVDWLDSALHGIESSPANDIDAPIQADELTQEQLALLNKQAGDLFEDMRTYLSQAKVNGKISVAKLRTFDASVGQFYHLSNMEVLASIASGKLLMQFVAGLNGGTIRSSYATSLIEETPQLTYEKSLKNVIATEEIQPQISQYFPGNMVNGLFHRQESSSVSLPIALANLLDARYPLRAIGTAQTITTDGMIEGRAAPKFVTRIFPGLNLAKYHYDKMTGFAKFREDGVAENDMVFRGQTYDIYIDGTTDAENIGRYEIGLILLGTPQSAEWNHLYRQGRIPLLKLRARIEGGKMHDESVAYLWPNETLFVIFLKNNLFYRLWLANQQP